MQGTTVVQCSYLCNWWSLAATSGQSEKILYANPNSLFIRLFWFSQLLWYTLTQLTRLHRCVITLVLLHRCYSPVATWGVVFYRTGWNPCHRFHQRIRACHSSLPIGEKVPLGFLHLAVKENHEAVTHGSGRCAPNHWLVTSLMYHDLT